MQERIEELRKHSFEVSQHDSTLSDLESDSERSIEDRFISAQHHLAAFQASLSKLKDRGESVPGFDGVEELLEDPSKAGALHWSKATRGCDLLSMISAVQQHQV